MSRKKFKCLDCKVDTGKIGEFYMLKDEVWLSIAPSNKGMLCIDCVEIRLGRLLTPDDFTKCHINKLAPTKIFSNKLIKRIFGHEIFKSNNRNNNRTNSN